MRHCTVLRFWNGRVLIGSPGGLTCTMSQGHVMPKFEYSGNTGPDGAQMRGMGGVDKGGDENKGYVPESCVLAGCPEVREAVSG
jgi:hypothetical protein